MLSALLSNWQRKAFFFQCLVCKCKDKKYVMKKLAGEHVREQPGSETLK